MKPSRDYERLLLALGSFGPLGRLPASGTCTVLLLGVPCFALLHQIPLVAYFAVLLAFTVLAVVIHDVGDRALGTEDSRQLVWDELAGFLVAITGISFTWQTCLAAVLVERAMDVLKVPPANWIDRRVHGGIGVVGDDVVAGGYTCLILHLLCAYAPHWMGVA